MASIKFYVTAAHCSHSQRLLPRLTPLAIILLTHTMDNILPLVPAYACVIQIFKHTIKSGQFRVNVIAPLDIYLRASRKPTVLPTYHLSDPFLAN